MSKSTEFCAHFVEMVADGEYDRVRAAEKRKTRNQQRTVDRRATRNAVDAYYAGEIA